MSFLKKLFGLGSGASNAAGSDDGASASGPAQEIEGFSVTATPYENNGRWQLCGVIAKEINGERKEHRFIRADTFATREEAEAMVFFKARQMIGQLGERVLTSG
ncbi:MAG: hypothetical protein FJX29_14200 [Alphaproteobacteria bacterium]|nr:hypothetical protein [Alphaproteobacteria bacterium]